MLQSNLRQDELLEEPLHVGGFGQSPRGSSPMAQVCELVAHQEAEKLQSVKKTAKASPGSRCGFAGLAATPTALGRSPQSSEITNSISATKAERPKKERDLLLVCTGTGLWSLFTSVTW